LVDLRILVRLRGVPHPAHNEYTCKGNNNYITAAEPVLARGVRSADMRGLARSIMNNSRALHPANRQYGLLRALAGSRRTARTGRFS